MTTNPGLYLHLPFCSSICPYCDFYVLTGNRGQRAEFVESLLAEISLCRHRTWPDFLDPEPRSAFDTLYLGGGTPSLLDPEQLGRILDDLRRHLDVDEDVWLALEANPEDVTATNLAAWSALGCDFLSLGVQSFDRRSLEFLGRRHRSADSQRSVALAREAGYPTLSIDLIYGLPGQTAADWRAELEQAVESRPDHLSCYQLGMEAGTPFGFRKQRGALRELDEETQAELFFLTHRYLEDRGFLAYEVSNFAAAPEHRSRHNRKYWSHTPFLGLGPSAHSFASRQRWWNERKIRPYQASLAAGERPIQGHEALSPTQLCLEHLMLGLRTPEGVDVDALPDALGEQLWHQNRALIEALVQRDLVTTTGRRLQPTLAGMALAEGIARDLKLPAG